MCASTISSRRACSFFGRYSFVDTNTFRPAPLPGLAEGSFNDAFGSNLNRSQGLALGLTWIASASLVGDFRFGFARGNYFTNPPFAGENAAADFGIPNVPERSRDCRRPPEDEYSGLRRRGAPHVDSRSSRRRGHGIRA